MTTKAYHLYTSYTDEEDKKRLGFIIETIKAHVSPGAAILDVGCGNGNISRALASCGYNVTGIDISEESVETARKNNPFENLRFIVGNAEDLPVDSAFEAVVCSEVLEHLNHPEELLSSIEKLVPKGKLLVVTVPNGLGPREALVTRPVQMIQKNGGAKVISGIKKSLGYKNYTVQSSNSDLSHIQFFTKGSLSRLISRFNFRNVAFQNANFVEKVFPFSLFAKRSAWLQKLDCKVADFLPTPMTSGFYTAWIKE